MRNGFDRWRDGERESVHNVENYASQDIYWWRNDNLSELTEHPLACNARKCFSLVVWRRQWWWSTLFALSELLRLRSIIGTFLLPREQRGKYTSSIHGQKEEIKITNSIYCHSTILNWVSQQPLRVEYVECPPLNYPSIASERIIMNLIPMPILSTIQQQQRWKGRAEESIMII